MNSIGEAEYPSISDIVALRQKLTPWIINTPMLRCRGIEDAIGDEIEVWGKLEFLQQTGTFKPRGALANILSMNNEQLQAGVTAVSAGNHAIATAYAAAVLGTSAKVVMIKGANRARIDACNAYGAELIFADTVHEAFTEVENIVRAEGRRLVHPFEGRNVAMGTATVGVEICHQLDEFDVLICPIGGGGLCAGISSAVKQLRPECTVIGVEPRGADSMHRTFAQGQTVKLENVATIADSLGAPFAMPYSAAICRKFVDELVLISDDQLREAMAFLFRQMKMAVEPACAATTAALMGPLRQRFAGKRVVLVFCGSNIDAATFFQHAALAA